MRLRDFGNAWDHGNPVRPPGCVRHSHDVSGYTRAQLAHARVWVHVLNRLKSVCCGLVQSLLGKPGDVSSTRSCHAEVGGRCGLTHPIQRRLQLQRCSQPVPKPSLAAAFTAASLPAATFTSAALAAAPITTTTIAATVSGATIAAAPLSAAALATALAAAALAAAALATATAAAAP